MKPDWLIVRGSAIKERRLVTELLSDLRLHTVCQEAACPNMVECFGRKTATFMIMGAQCTRGCAFCNVSEGIPSVLNKDEPQAVAQAVSRLELNHVVITSVTRDDLEDGGAKHFENTIRAVRNMNPGTTIEVLIPDLKGDESSLGIVLQGSPDVIAHNIETVPALYEDVRSQADYNRSLSVLAFIKKEAPLIFSKSGIMLGLGEEPQQVLSVLMDLRKVGCDFVTIGQYLAPTTMHYPLKRYVHPDEFKEYEELAYSLGFTYVASGPLVRSSYHADEAMHPTVKVRK